MTRRIVNFLDLETTGVNEPDERIIEHCSMLFDLDTKLHLKTHVWRCNPMRKINKKAQAAHGIALADLENEPLFDAVAPLIRGTINTAYLGVAHNGDEFDFPFLERECERVGAPVQFLRKFDTMKGARWATSNGKNPRLGELAACLDVPYDPALAHAASYDTEVLAKCFFEGQRIGWFPQF